MTDPDQRDLDARIHAAPLADDGYDVHLLAPVRAQVEAARASDGSALTSGTPDPPLGRVASTTT